MVRKSAVLAVAACLGIFPPCLAAQSVDGMEEMGASMAASRHLTLTPHWAPRDGDAARADSLVRVAREAMAKYQDVSLAEADGYRMFAPKVKQQKVYHYSNRRNAVRAQWTFEAAAPTSLLYQPLAGGQLRLIGVMYTAPASSSMEELNARIPLSVAQWHEHTSICLPPGAKGEMGLMTRDPRFGPRGSISTEEACKAAGGTFKARMLNWMVHVNVFEAPDRVWEHKH